MGNFSKQYFTIMFGKIYIIIIIIIIGVLFPLPSLSSPVKKIVLINMWVFLTKNGQSHVNMNEMVNNHKL